MATIILKKLVGAEARTRSLVSKIRRLIENKEPYIIDMSGVEFISRSFADELYNLEIDNDNIKFANRSKHVAKMMEVVKKSRSGERVRDELRNEVSDMSSIDKFKAFLQNI